ncbi:MAG: 50S ribosomal protein L7/L12 [Candidatus Cloacimonetes bacterium]|nr:50S ribosomal protein L7/L12 [Candidatus Cloacimonadota bacterium]MDD2650815.1 50S ribosomal protein L7/L12 [Candidatus Cloacimonadota bacterium]
MSDKKQQIIDTLKEMTVIELSELVKELEEIFGVSAAAPVAVAAAGAAPAAAVEEKTEFDVIITAAGEKKINVIKVVRELVSSLGLKEAKELVDNPPKAVLENVDKAEAEAAKAKLVEAGASVDIK